MCHYPPCNSSISFLSLQVSIPVLPLSVLPPCISTDPHLGKCDRRVEGQNSRLGCDGPKGPYLWCTTPQAHFQGTRQKCHCCCLSIRWQCLWNTHLGYNVGHKDCKNMLLLGGKAQWKCLESNDDRNCNIKYERDYIKRDRDKELDVLDEIGPNLGEWLASFSQGSVKAPLDTHFHCWNLTHPPFSPGKLCH